MPWRRRRRSAVDAATISAEPSPAPTPIVQETDAPDSPDGTQLAILLGAATAAVDEQFKRAERLDAKARGQLTIVGAFFAFVQTITAGTLRAQDDLTWVLFAVAAVAAVCLFVALVTSSFAWKLRKERALNPDDITGWIPYAKAGNPQVGIKLTKELAAIYQNRLDANQSRSDDLRTATKWVLAAAAATSVELVLALLFLVV